VRDFNERLVFQAWDMLAGRLLPELGGSRAHLDIVGINYYWTNQWEWGTAPTADKRFTPLDEDDRRRVPLRDLVRSVWERYGGEILISETAHIGEYRADWLLEVAREAEALLWEGIPLKGVCWYPILGMPEWHAPDVWAPMGLWDTRSGGEAHERALYEPMRDALKSVRYMNTLSRRLLGGPEKRRERLAKLDEVRRRAEVDLTPAAFSRRRVRGR
jgi:hypothetical protein